MSGQQSYTSHSGFDQRLNVPTSQAVSLPKNYTQLFQRTSFNTVPVFGGVSTVTFRLKGVSLTKMWLEFTLASGISGLTITNSGTAGFLPVPFWASRLEIMIGSQVIDTIFPLSNFLETQAFIGSDEKRSLANTAMGVWNNHASRATRTASGQVWYLPINSFISQGSFPILPNSPDIEIRLTMETLANSYSITSGSAESGTAVFGGFSSVNLVTQHSILPQPTIDYHTTLLRRAPLHFGFLETRQQTIPIASGSTSITQVLSGLSGTASFLMFAIRNANPVKGDQVSFVNTLSSWELLNGSSTSLVGGQPLTDNLTRFVIGQIINTTFFSDSGVGVYLYPFSHDPQSSFDSSLNLSTYTFRGSETLRLTFSSALGANAQCDVYAFCHSAIEVSPNNVRKISLTVT